jgi:hypothetical protein
MRSSVLLLPLLVLAFQSHQTASRGEPSLKPVTEAGWRGLLPASDLDPQTPDPTRPGCTPQAGRSDARDAAPSPGRPPTRPGWRSVLSRMAADMDRHMPPFPGRPAADSAGTAHGVS